MKKGNYASPVVEFDMHVVDVILASEIDNFGEYIWGEEGQLYD